MNRFKPIVLFPLIVALLAGPMLSMAHAQEATPEVGRTMAPVLWQTRSSGTLGVRDHPIAIADGLIFVVEQSGRLSARNLTTGALEWRKQTGLSAGDLNVSADGNVVAVVRGKQMKVYRATDGVRLWELSVSNPFDVLPPASFSGTTLITSELADDPALPHSTGTIYGYNELTGVLSWEHVAEGGLDNYIIPVADGRAFVSLSDGNVVALDATTGAVAWQNPAFTSGYVAPVISGTFLLAQGNDGGQPTLTAFDRLTGAQRWTADSTGTLAGVVGASVIVNTVSFESGTASESVDALDIETGQQLWSMADKTVTASVFAGNNGFLSTYSTSAAGALEPSVLKVDPTTGDVDGSLALEDVSYSLVPCGDKILVRHGDYIASVLQSDLSIGYDYAVGELSPQAVCDGGDIAASVSSNGIVAVHDTTITPDLGPGIVKDALPASPFFTTEPILVPQQTDDLVVGVWRAELSSNNWIVLPPDVAGLNLYVETGSVILLESAEQNDPDPEARTLEAGEIIEIPEGGSQIRADNGEVASIYLAGLMSRDTAEAVGSEILPDADSIALMGLDDPIDQELTISVSAFSAAEDTGTVPRLSPWPSSVFVTSGSLDVITSPGVQNPELLAKAKAVLLADAGDSEQVEANLIYSIVASAGPADGVVVSLGIDDMVQAAGCAGRCIVR